MLLNIMMYHCHDAQVMIEKSGFSQILITTPDKILGRPMKSKIAHRLVLGKKQCAHYVNAAELVRPS